MPPITRNISRAVRRNVAEMIVEQAKNETIENVERTPLWSQLDNAFLADIVGFTDTSGRTSCATTEEQHYRLRKLGLVDLFGS
jgi:predicted alpha/beta-fold hydrolase